MEILKFDKLVILDYYKNDLNSLLLFICLGFVTSFSALTVGLYKRRMC